MKKVIVSTPGEACGKAAEIFAAQVRSKPDSVLGLATGSTPVAMYKKLVEAHKNEGLNFSKVTTFNLDEYYPISKSNDQSYYYFMHENLFDHINVPAENINLPNGEAPDAEAECARYEKSVTEAGVDIQLLGIGNNGHIAFNEPDSFLYDATHVTGLAENTIKANARFFASADDVPKTALTMGVGTILRSKKIVLIATGEAKQEAVKAMFSGRLDPQCPATFLQVHPDVTVILDEAAASLL